MDIYKLFNQLNNSKYFAGIMMILLNLISKYISLELSETQEEFLNNIIIRRIAIFTIVFVATKDIVISFIITACFIIIVSGLFNEESKYCLIRKKNRKSRVISKLDVEKAKKIIDRFNKQNSLRENSKLEEKITNKLNRKN
jgi:uncharacterized membrane protein (DUF485 family)